MQVTKTTPPTNTDQRANTLSRAFADDPAFAWILQKDSAFRQQRLVGFFNSLLVLSERSGFVLASADAEVVSVWRRPGAALPDGVEHLRSAWPILRTFRSCVGRASKVGDAMHAQHPAQGDFLYLTYLGVHPDHQGKGLGGAALRAGIEQSREIGKPVVLETAKRDNVGLYQRFGFEVTSHWSVPANGPEFWTMTRPIDAEL